MQLLLWRGLTKLSLTLFFFLYLILDLSKLSTHIAFVPPVTVQEGIKYGLCTLTLHQLRCHRAPLYLPRATSWTRLSPTWEQKEKNIWTSYLKWFWWIYTWKSAQNCGVKIRSFPYLHGAALSTILDTLIKILDTKLENCHLTNTREYVTNSNFCDRNCTF